MRGLRDWLDDRMHELHRVREEHGPEGYVIVVAIGASLAMLAGMLCAGLLTAITARL